MPRYLLTLHRPQGYGPAAQLSPADRHAIDQLNDAMDAAGVKRFVAGLRPPDTTHTFTPAPTPSSGAEHHPASAADIDAASDTSPPADRLPTPASRPVSLPTPQQPPSPSADPNPAPTYIDGLWILETPNLADAQTWAQKAATACRGTTQLRPFY